MRQILSALVLLASIAHAKQSTKQALSLKHAKNKTACDYIHPEELPKECFCKEPGPFSLLVQCNKKFTNKYFNDTIGMKIDVEPCNPLGSSISLDVVEKDHDIDYTITGIRAGESKNIPIPGLSILVPGIGHLGVDAAVYIGGNPDQLTLKVGLNACVAVSDKNMCASSIPGLKKILPWYVLSGTYAFGEICKNNATLAEM